MAPMPDPSPLDYAPPDPKRKHRVLLTQFGIIALA